MRLLYLSCHAILEYDDLKIFEELGIDYFSLGAYTIPTKEVEGVRPALTHKPDEKLYSILPEDKEHLTKVFLDNFDVIVVMHTPEWIEKNWEVLKGRRVIWRSIGQSVTSVENRLRRMRNEGLQIVRYSPKEQNIAGNLGCDKMIRFYKDENEFCNYNGLNPIAITIAQNMKHRGEFCNYEAFTKIIEGLNAKLYGIQNEESGELSGGSLSFNDLKQKLRDSRVFIYTGTQPASYTLGFMEAFMTGIPVVALGDRWANSMRLAGDTYEIPDFIVNGVNGFVSDDLNSLREYTKQLLEDHKLALRIGEMGRDTARDIFSKEKVKLAWKEFLGI